ncbi:MAG: ATP-binding protein, partial [Actinomycetota bacterium]
GPSVGPVLHPHGPFVQDEGPGVPADQRQLIFERFSRGAEAGRRTGDRGVGLGLALVAEHIALHEGSVWVEDRPDGRPGARFVVELPREPG